MSSPINRKYGDEERKRRASYNSTNRSEPQDAANSYPPRHCGAGGHGEDHAFHSDDHTHFDRGRV